MSLFLIGVTMFEYTKKMFSLMNIPQHTIETLNDDELDHELDFLFYDAIKHINHAIKNNQKIFVGGDFDADGICATTIMVKYLKKKNADVGYYISDRIVEGYGVPIQKIQAAIDKDYELFIFVDNGVSLHDELELLNTHNKTSLILDHHTIEQKPACSLLIHPDRLSEYYDRLCGAGLSYVLAKADKLDDSEMLQLAMVATIGDMMPLVRFNRSLVRHGLRSINESPMVHLSNLVKKQNIDEEDVAFLIVPKLNAVGRLSDQANVNSLVSFFLNEDVGQVVSFVHAIEELNNNRKKIAKNMEKKALEYLTDDAFNFIVDQSFHEGVVGILAGSIMRSTNKPTMVATIKQDIIKGSLRSDTVDLFELISHASNYVTRFGGHSKAAGIEVKATQFESFKQEILQRLENIEVPLTTQPVAVIDEKLISLEAIKEFESYRPFGMEFERPIVALTNVSVIRSYHNDKVNLRKWMVSVNNTMIEAVLFSDLFDEFKKASALTLIGTIAYKPYNSSDKIVCKVHKVLPAHCAQDEILI